jgi:hypothetical protein
MFTTRAKIFINNLDFFFFLKIKDTVSCQKPVLFRL